MSCGLEELGVMTMTSSKTEVLEVFRYGMQLCKHPFFLRVFSVSINSNGDFLASSENC